MKKIILILLILKSCILCYSNEILTINYMNENNSISFSDGITINEAVPLTIYSESQITSFLEQNELKTYDNFGLSKCSFDINNRINVNGTELYKAFIYRQKKNKIYSGVCVYININNDFRKKHTYILSDYVTVVYDDTGKMYYIIDDYFGISIYSSNQKLIENGSLSYGLYGYNINYIDSDTKRIMSYCIKNESELVLKQLPPFFKPKLFWGLDIRQPNSVSDLCLKEICESNIVNDDYAVFRDFIIGRDIDGNVYELTTTYLLDYDFDGSRKKGIYKIKGDTWEFLPDL